MLILTLILGVATVSFTTGKVDNYPREPEHIGSGKVKWSEIATPDGWTIVINEGGTTLGYSENSGLKLIQVDGYAFKDLNRNHLLVQFEDWRSIRQNDVRRVACNGNLHAGRHTNGSGYRTKMETVEAQFEDVPRDMECFVDSEGNTYDFAFGLNWSGAIKDDRAEKYSVAPIVGEPPRQMLFCPQCIQN